MSRTHINQASENELDAILAQSNVERVEGSMRDKISLEYDRQAYRDHPLKITVGDKEIPLTSVGEDLKIYFHPDNGIPILMMELYLDYIAIEDIEAIAEYVRIK